MKYNITSGMRPTREAVRYREGHTEYETWQWLLENNHISRDEFNDAVQTLQPVSIKIKFNFRLLIFFYSNVKVNNFFVSCRVKAPIDTLQRTRMRARTRARTRTWILGATKIFGTPSIAHFVTHFVFIAKLSMGIFFFHVNIFGINKILPSSICWCPNLFFN